MLLIKNLKETRFLSYVGVTTFLFGALITISYFYWDIPIAKYFHERSLFEGFSLFISYIFEPKRLIFYLTFFLFVLRFLFKKKEESNILFFLVLSLAMTTLISDWIKWFVGRDRPELLFSDNLHSFVPFTMDNAHRSFPSGHAASIAAIFLSLAYLFPKHSYTFILLTFLLSFTRILLEVHYFSDIIAAIWLGSLISQFIYKTMKQENSLTTI